MAVYFILLFMLTITDIALYLSIKKTVHLTQDLAIANSKIINILGKDYIERNATNKDLKEGDIEKHVSL